jgi:hypothetical protein
LYCKAISERRILRAANGKYAQASCEGNRADRESFRGIKTLLWIACATNKPASQTCLELPHQPLVDNFSSLAGNNDYLLHWGAEVDIGYVSLACGFVVLAIAVNLITNFDARAWIAKGLQRGDLHALIDVASGLRPNGLTAGQAARLQARGMVRVSGNGRFRATLKGRLALRIRRMVRQRPDLAA